MWDDAQRNSDPHEANGAEERFEKVARRITVVGPENLPELWDRYHIPFEFLERRSDDAELDRYEMELMPVVKPIAELMDHDPGPQEMRFPNRPLRLDFGDGPKWYNHSLLESFGPLLPHDAPSEVDLDELAVTAKQEDAWRALCHIARIRNGSESVRGAIYLGRLIQQVRFDAYREIIIDGITRREDRQRAGKASAALTDEEWQMVVAARMRLTREDPHGGARNAAKVIWKQLSTGMFPGINRKLPRVPAPGTIERKRLNR